MFATISGAACAPTLGVLARTWSFVIESLSDNGIRNKRGLLLGTIGRVFLRLLFSEGLKKPKVRGRTLRGSRRWSCSEPVGVRAAADSAPMRNPTDSRQTARREFRWEGERSEVSRVQARGQCIEGGVETSRAIKSCISFCIQIPAKSPVPASALMETKGLAQGGPAEKGMGWGFTFGVRPQPSLPVRNWGPRRGRAAGRLLPMAVDNPSLLC